jgi:cobalt-zinc-cadmium efflux system membrane fusion protein
VVAYPDRIFDGRVSAIGASVDATSHRFLVRSEINDPERLLRPGMFASFVIVVSNPTEAPALPKDGAVREGDGTMSAWVTTDRRHFTRRIVQIGLQQDGFDEIRSGLEPGELVVTDGAIFLSNMLESGSAAD